MILSYKDLQLASHKELVTQQFYEKLEDFTRHDNTQKALKVFEPAYFRPHKKNPTTLHKIRIPLSESNTSTLDIIQKKSAFHSFVWHTTADKIRIATRWGIIKTYSVTSKVIAALGQYRMITQERLREAYSSRRYVEKQVLLDYYQSRFEILQKLENIIHHNLTPEEIHAVLDRYESDIYNLSFHYKGDHFALLGKINKGQDQAIADLVQYRKIVSAKFHEVSLPTGTASILTFVKTQMIHSLKEMQSINQQLTYTSQLGFAATRGDLNSCIIDAEKVIHDYVADPHNPFLNKHHGIYGADTDRVAYRSTQQGLSAEEEQHALIAISVIEGLISADKNDSKTVSATKWAATDSGWVTLKRIAAFNVRVLFGLLDLFLAPITLPLRWIKINKPSNLLTRLATYEINPTKYQYPKRVNDILRLSHRRMSSLRSRVGDYIYIIVDHIRDLLNSLHDVSKKIVIGLVLDIKNDASAATDKKEIFTTLKREAIKEIEQIELRKAEKLKPLALQVDVASLKTQAKAQEIPELKRLQAPTEIQAIPEFLPNAGVRNDITNAIARGNDIFFGFFFHHLYAKHPFTALVFTSAYVVGGLSVLAPSAMSFMGPVVGVSQTLGSAMAQGQLSGAFASGFTMAKVAAGMVELGLHGPKSWISSGLKEAEKDPVAAVFYTAGAISLGYVLSYELEIPFLSEYLKEDIGTIWPVAAGLVGAKLGVLLFELFYFEDADEMNAANAINEKIRQLVLEAYYAAHPEQDPAEIRREVNRMTTKLEDPALRDKLRHEYDTLVMLNFMRKNSAYLPHFSEHLKNKMMKNIEQSFSPLEARSLRMSFYPEKPLSIMRTTMNIIGDYFVFMLRYVAALVTSCKLSNTKPLARVHRDFVFKLKKDMMRIFQALALIVKTVVSGIRTILKSFADVLVNSLIARPIALVMQYHRLSDFVYAVSASGDAAFEKSRQFFSHYLDVGTKAVTVPHPITTFHAMDQSSLTYIKRKLNIPIKSTAADSTILGASQARSVTFPAKESVSYQGSLGIDETGYGFDALFADTGPSIDPLGVLKSPRNIPL